jgi:prolipoprotein diacylglyceryl transferase
MRWDVDPVLVEIGPLTIRWYGFFFVVGLSLSIAVLDRVFRQRDFPAKHAHALSLWIPVGMLIGAHLGHLLFYEPRALIENPRRLIEIGLGLSSHGGAAGTVLALWIFCRRKRVSFARYLDAAMIAASWTFPWVRIGNFFNSEIYGAPTTLPWGVVFARTGLPEARHPTQLYGALMCLSVALFGLWLNRRRDRLAPGETFCAMMLAYFSARFLIEFTKIYQVMPGGSVLRMGQILSLPLIVLFAILLLYARRRR